MKKTLTLAFVLAATLAVAQVTQRFDGPIVTSTGPVTTAAASSFNFGTDRSRVFSPADSRVLLTNAAQTAFDRLQFGGTAATFPALKRSGTQLHVRLADDSAYSILRASGLVLNSGSAITDAADGIIQLSNGAQTDFSRLQFGGSTSSFPSLKRSTTQVHVRLADDSAFALLRTSGVVLNNGSAVQDTGDGLIRLSNGAVNDFNRLTFGGTTSAFPSLKRTGTTIQARLADDSAFASLSGSTVTGTGNLMIGTSSVIVATATAPTISAGFGTSPAIAAGTAHSFRLTVGTGGTANTGTVTLPASAAGWNCEAEDITNHATHDTAFTGSTTTSASFTNYSRTTGTLTAWTAGDTLAIKCSGY